MAPRDWLENPALYGKSLKAPWRPAPNDAELPAYSAAYLQHTFACQVEEACRDEGVTKAQLAARAGLSEGHLNHVLRGRQGVTLTTMIAVVRALGRVELLPAPASLADLAPS